MTPRPSPLLAFTVHAVVALHAMPIAGSRKSGWWVEDRPDAEVLPFHFSIQDDGAGHCLLVYASLDGRFAADSWHATLEDAYETAEELGIARSAWTVQPKPSSRRKGRRG